MTEVPQIGVVVVNYNSGPYLSRCIGSLLRSDRRLRIVIVDNASEDTSLQDAARVDPGDHELVTVRNDNNLGFSKAVNIGAAQLQTRLVMLLNPDCEVHPHTLGRLAATFDRNEGAGVVGALVFNEDGTEQRGCRRREPTLKRSIITSFRLGGVLQGVDMTHEPLPPVASTVDAVSGSAMMMRLDRFREIGGMEESYFLHCEDLDICHRMRNAGYQVIFEPGVSLFHRQGASGSASRKNVERLKHDGMLNYYRRHYHSGPRITLHIMEVLLWIRLHVTLLVDRLPTRDRDMASPEMLPSIGGDELRLLLTGASSDAGAAVIHRLRSKNEIPCIAITRNPRRGAGRGAVRILSTEYFEKAPLDDLPLFRSWLQLAPIWTWRNFETVFRRGKPTRIVALSSTSVVTKADSDDPKEKAVVEALQDGERGLSRFAIRCKASVAILRPTMIYGGPRNRNINLLRRWIRWFRFFPLVGEGSGERQPVHADEVADACLAALARDGVSGVYTIAGGEVLSYRDMVLRVFESLGIKPRIVTLSRGTADILVRLTGKLPGLDMLSGQMLDRLDRDQSFSNASASRDFDFRPGPFNP